MEGVATTSQPEATAPVEKQDPAAPMVGGSETSYKALYELFDLKQETRHDTALKAIWEYAKKQSNSTEKDEIRWEVKKLLNKLGSANIGELPYFKAWNYVDTWKQLREKEKRLKEMERA